MREEGLPLDDRHGIVATMEFQLIQQAVMAAGGLTSFEPSLMDPLLQG